MAIYGSKTSKSAWRRHVQDSLDGLVVFVNGTEQTLSSGTSAEFTDIPVDIRMLVLQLDGLSTNGTAEFRIRLGSTTYTTTGYDCTACRLEDSGNVVSINSQTDGFRIRRNSTGDPCDATLIFTLIDPSGNKWLVNGSGNLGDNEWNLTSGTVSLSDTLDRIEIASANDTDTFDAGSINIMYDSTPSEATVVLSPTEVNDLTDAVTWANVPDANITESSVTQHQAALAITKSQVSDLEESLAYFLS